MSGLADVVVVGAGIVGAACARACALRGLRTVVVDGAVVGGGATAAGMGHIVAMDDSPAQLALTAYSQQLWREMAEDLPPEVEFDACGTLWVAADEEEMAEVRRKQGVYASIGIATEVLDSHALAEAEPHLRRGLAGALQAGSDAVLYPPCAAAFLIREAQRAGAEVLLGQAVVSAGQGRVRLQNGTALSAARIVLAAGADSSRLLPGVPVRKRRGHLVITDRYPGYVRHQLVELGYLKSAHSMTTDSVAFNVQPRKTGQLLIGSSREYGAEVAEVNRALMTAMLARAESYLPGLGALGAIRVWTGFRAATPDKLPLIGPWPGDATLWLATGHEGLGITTSLGTAEVLVTGMLGGKRPIPPEPYLPGRFAGAHEGAPVTEQAHA
ncbi:MAG TPA: FAD-binding oxidoreductase [Acidobacteriaceae bacterium]|jgi:glycine/D-amino acid oxidase-like deaminating enzyme|nr:FAD-binding oxidoreductase [Acidobacteriaceae bacterium]